MHITTTTKKPVFVKHWLCVNHCSWYWVCSKIDKSPFSWNLNPSEDGRNRQLKG